MLGTSSKQSNDQTKGSAILLGGNKQGQKMDAQRGKRWVRFQTCGVWETEGLGERDYCGSMLKDVALIEWEYGLGYNCIHINILRVESFKH